MNAIIGYSEMLQENVDDVGQETFVPDLKKIEGAGRHLLGLINDILDGQDRIRRKDVFLENFDAESRCSKKLPLHRSARGEKQQYA